MENSSQEWNNIFRKIHKKTKHSLPLALEIENHQYRQNTFDNRLDSILNLHINLHVLSKSNGILYLF